MTLIVFCFITAAIIIAYALMHNANIRRKTDEELSMDLLRRARTMFPSAENDIVALDGLYEQTFRRSLIAEQEGGDTFEQLRRETILIFNLKNRSIADQICFEETVRAQFHGGHVNPQLASR